MKVKYSILPKFLKRQNKIRNKAPYFLVELLVSFALINIVGFYFFNIQNSRLKLIEESYYQLEADRAMQHAVARVVERLYMKEYKWDELLHAVQKRESLKALAPHFSCTYTFSGSRLSTDAQKMRVKVAIQLIRDDSTKWERFCEKYNQKYQKTHFEFCVIR